MDTRSDDPSPDQVVSIGEELGVNLPVEYVETLTHYPFPRVTVLARVILYAEPLKVIDQNRQLRSRGFFGHSWPQHFLIIGDFENGDLIFLDTTRAEPLVLVACHELSACESDLAVQDTGFLLEEWTRTILQEWRARR